MRYYLDACSGHREIVVHLCHPWWEVFAVPGMSLDLRDGYPVGRVWNQDVREQISALFGDLHMRWELILHLQYPLQTATSRSEKASLQYIPLSTGNVITAQASQAQAMRYKHTLMQQLKMAKLTTKVGTFQIGALLQECTWIIFCSFWLSCLSSGRSKGYAPTSITYTMTPHDHMSSICTAAGDPASVPLKICA